mgnify:FL=1|tara:strand:- start:94 stop:552 length:459 start_codon:yes stop_codon:yes gene_type:complete
MKNSLVLLSLALALFSCKSPESITTNNDTFRFVEREISDTTLQGFDLETTISLPEFIERRIYDTLTITDPKTKGELKLWKNKYGDLVAQCTSQDATIKLLREKVREYESRVSETVIEVDNRNWWEKLTDLIPNYVFVGIGLLIGLYIGIRFL